MLLANSVIAQTIRISSQATVAERQDVRLGDLATITNTDSRTAEHLANLVILPQLRESRAVRAESILMAVIAQVGAGPLADRLQIPGSAHCQIKIETPVVVQNTTQPIATAVAIPAHNHACESPTPLLILILSLPAFTLLPSIAIPNPHAPATTPQNNKTHANFRVKNLSSVPSILRIAG